MDNTMRKNNNIQVIMNAIIKQEYEENNDIFNSEDSFFEFYSAQQILKEFDLTFDELYRGITGSSLDGGCDSLYIFINGELITEDTNLKILIHFQKIQLTNGKQYVQIYSILIILLIHLKVDIHKIY